MAKKTVNIRLAIKDHETVKRALIALGKDGQRALARIEKGAEPASRQLRILDATVGNLQRQMRGGLATLAAAFSVRALGQMTEAYRNLDNRLRQVTDSEQERAALMRELADRAAENRSSIEATVDTYFRFDRALGDIIEDEQRLLDITSTVNQTVALSGTTFAASDGALRQFGQGLAADALRGQELNSVMEQTPRLAKALADGLGVPIGQLRRLAEEGRLTTANVLGALESQSDIVAQEFTNLTLTMGQGWMQLADAGILAVGWMDDASGASSGLGAAMVGLAQAIRENEDAWHLLGDLAGLSWDQFNFIVPVRDAAAGVGVLSSSFADLRTNIAALLETDDQELADMFRGVGFNPAVLDRFAGPVSGDMPAPRHGNMFAGRPEAPSEIEANLAIVEQLQGQLTTSNNPIEQWLARLSDDALPGTIEQVRALAEELVDAGVARRAALALEREAGAIRANLQTAEERYNAELARTAEMVAANLLTEDARAERLEDVAISLGLAKDAEAALNEEKERARALDERAADLRESLMTDQQRLNQDIGEYFSLMEQGRLTQTEYNNLVEQAGEQYTQATFSAEKFGDRFADHMLAATRSTEGFINSLDDVILKLAEMMLFEQILRPGFAAVGNAIGASIAGAFNPSASRHGNVFMGGDPMPFRSGGVVSRPTTFGFSSGGYGKMAEEKPEGILPLFRGSDGDLGVKAHGGAAPVVNVNLIGGGAENARVEQKRGANGAFDINVFLDESVAGLMTDPGSKTGSVMALRGAGAPLDQLG